MPVPNIFASATSAIPLSQLDQNFATAITLGNTAVYLGNTTTSLGNVTLTNVTISSGNVTVSAGSNTSPSITTVGDTNTGIFFPAADTIAFSEGGVESMRIDASGNMGLGVTPSAWNSSTKAIQVGDYGCFSWNGYEGGTVVGNNVYQSASTTENYIATGVAPTKYRLSGGSHSWYTAASGTAGNAISFTQAMTLDASGNLGVGVTSVSSQISGSAKVIGICDPTTTNLASIRLGSGSTFASGTRMEVFSSGSSCGLYGQDAVPMTFTTNSTERARITSGGDLLVGTTTKLAGGIDGLDINTAADTGITFAQSGTVKAYFYLGGGGAGTNWQWQTVAGIVVNVVSSTNGVTLTNGSTSWGSLSDERKKDIIEPIVNATTKVSSLRAVIGKYKTEEDGIRRAMLIAQDVQAVLPEAVVENKDGDLILQYTDTIPLLVAAIKEQQAIITQLQADVAALKGTA